MATSPLTETVSTTPKKRIRISPQKALKSLTHPPRLSVPQAADTAALSRYLRDMYGPQRVDLLRLGRRAAKKILTEVVEDSENANRAVAGRLVSEQWARVDPAISRSEVSGTIQHEIVSPALAESLQRAYERYLPSLADEPIEGRSEPVFNPEDTELPDSPSHNLGEDSVSESDVVDTVVLTPEDSR
jgi:hypothetical protein